MPNWCYNSVSVSHSDPAMITKLVEAANSDNGFFNAFVPMPEELRNTVSPSPTNESLVEKYGASDWYSWSVNNWGTKWDTSATDINVSNEGRSCNMSFDTAWSPPIPFYDALVELGFDVDATYTEEGMGFAGHYENGEDESVDLSFDKESERWINQISDDVLRDLVMCEYENWLSWQEEEEDAA